MTPSTRSLRPILALALAAALGVTACSGAAAPSPRPSADPTAPPVSGEPPAGSIPPSGGDGAVGNPGSGIGVAPVDPLPVDPGAGQPTLVRPLPGRANPHPVAPTALQASVDGRRVLVKITWYGGVEPCSVLDSVRVERSGMDIALTPIEGSSDLAAMCIEIAVLKATIIDLGELQPGTWRISSPGSDATPVVITID
jgi:hypothetical protein